MMLRSSKRVLTGDDEDCKERRSVVLYYSISACLYAFAHGNHCSIIVAHLK